MPVAFASEELEPFAARIIGLAASRYVEAKEAGDRFGIQDGLMNLWWAVNGLENIAIALRGSRSFKDTSGLHFSIAVSNEVSRIGTLIETELGIDPTKAHGWKEA